jgi:hypothetical protein
VLKHGKDDDDENFGTHDERNRSASGEVLDESSDDFDARFWSSDGDRLALCLGWRSPQGGSAEETPTATVARDNDVEGMMDGAAQEFQDLKELGPDHQVQAIQYHHDTFHVTTADGQSADFFEANLRFKIDSRATGPRRGKPVILPAGMQGDRALVFFASPSEISAVIKHLA